MKRLLFSLLFVLPSFVFAQNNITYSGTFSMPEKGVHKILILKNGNTAWLHLDNNLKLIVYDKQRKPIYNKPLIFKHKMPGKGADYFISKVYEHNEKLNVFMRRDHDRIITLYRMVIDLATGTTESIDELGRTTLLGDWGFNLGSMVFNNMYLEIDPVTNGYAVLTFNGYDRNSKERIFVKVYNDKNELIKEARVTTPAEQERFVHMSGFCMYDNAVYVGTHPFDPKRKKEQDLPFYISKLDANANEFDTKQVSITPYQNESYVNIRVNPITKQLMVLTNTNVAEQHTLGKNKVIVEAKFTIVDPNSLAIISSSVLSMDKLDNYAKSKLDDKKGFDRSIFYMYPKKNGSVLFVPEETYETTYRSGSGSGGTYTKEYVSKLGFVTYDQSGKEQSTYAMHIRTLAQVSGAPQDFFDYAILGMDNGDTYYLFMNDLTENMTKSENDKPHTLSTISDANAAICKVTNGKIERAYLYGAPADKKESTFAMVGCAAYDESTKTIATIIVERKGRDKKAKMAWVQL